MSKGYWYSGILAVGIYIFAVILGGMMYPGYSHISQDISQLTSTNSPIKDLMNIFFVYNILVAIFGYGLYKLRVKTAAKLGAISVILIGILGIIIAFFPINTRGTQISFTGVAHITIVSIVSQLTVASGFLFWAGFKKSKFELIGKISLIEGLLFLISGPIAAINVLSPYAGLFERIPIGIFLIWILLISFNLLKLKE